MDDVTLFSLSVLFFFVLDPIGNIIPYLTMMKDVPKKRQLWILSRELGIAFLLMVAFNYLGEYIFFLLEISDITVRLALGVILLLLAIKIIFPSTDSLRSNLPSGEPFIVPLAIPLLAGPSTLATVMLYAHLESSQALVLGAIAIAIGASFVVLFFSNFLNRILGKNGLVALEKLTGMILVLIAVQRFAEGIQLFLAQQ